MDAGKRKRLALSLTVCAAALTLWLGSFGKWRCPILLVTGARCAGCGMTTALYKLLKWDIAGAFQANPLIFVVLATAVAALVLYVRQGSKPLKSPWLWAVPLACFCVVGALRLLEAAGLS